MKPGDLVRYRWKGYGRPEIGMIISVYRSHGAHVLWNNSNKWPVKGYWHFVDMELIDENR